MESNRRLQGNCKQSTELWPWAHQNDDRSFHRRVKERKQAIGSRFPRRHQGHDARIPKVVEGHQFLFHVQYVTHLLRQGEPLANRIRVHGQQFHFLHRRRQVHLQKRVPVHVRLPRRGA